MFRLRFHSIALAILLAAGGTFLFADEPGMPKVVDFNTHIRPIFTSHCTSCHGGVKQAADLSFVYADSAMNTIESGDPEGSYLFEKIIEEDEDSRMPPADHGPALPAHDVELIRKWIQQGAKWGDHWAYQIPQRYSAPDVSQPQWISQPLDAFVLKQLDDRGVQPAEDERPERWLRRASLDLIGLPPTLEQRETFLSEVKRDGEGAYPQAVDRMLASPRFGERWASVWFDQVRYADSRGQGEDSPRTIWKYRDWVIESLNKDLGYDQFTIKQIAGDLLPNRTIEDQIATAVHRLTHSNEEGGTDDEEFRVAAVLDRVNTTWQTWQGTTFGCTQCHSHPYDPFTHDEYYKYTAFFNNTLDCDLNDDWPVIPVPENHDDYAAASELNRKIDELTLSLWETAWNVVSEDSQWSHLRITKAKTNKSAKLVIEPHEDWDEYFTTGTVPSGTSVFVEMPLPDSVSLMTGIRITGMPLDPDKALSESEWGFVMSNISAELVQPSEGEDGTLKDAKPKTSKPKTSKPKTSKLKTSKLKTSKLKFAQVFGDDPFPRYDPNKSLDGDREGYSAYTRIHHSRQVVLLFAKPVNVAPGSRLKLQIKHHVTELAAFPLVTRRAHFAVSSNRKLTALLDDKTLISKTAKLARLKSQRDEIKSTEIPVLQERTASLARPAHLFTRGNFLTKDKQVFPDVPKSLRPIEEPISNRLELANWLVSSDNPLTARVAVNRYWARMFGVGLVSTEEDFGSTGESPSHPQMLDDLSVRFREDYQWSVKKLLREIALSHTYRQSSRIRPDLQESDANNRWLARGPRHGLPAESVRDQMLAISGLLSDKMHGAPVHPPLPRGVWKARRGNWKTPKPGEEDRYRRSVYTSIKRSIPFPMAAAFDAPSRDFCSPKRLRSNTPLQPLMLMNDAGFVECADAFGKRMRAHSDELDQQITFGLLTATCREPDPDEISRLVKLYEQVEKSSNANIAMQSVASVILNLDEIISK